MKLNMISYLPVVALPQYQEEVAALLSHSPVMNAVKENELPPLVFQDATPFLLDEQLQKSIYTQEFGRSSFSQCAMGSKIVLGESFFVSETDWKLFSLLHELRHAHQYLVDPQWKSFCAERATILREIAGVQKVVLRRFLGGLLEFDAQAYACSRLPEVGSRAVLQFATGIVDYLRLVDTTSMSGIIACLGYLPYVYEWERLMREEFLLPSFTPRVEEKSQDVMEFLIRWTHLQKDEVARSLLDEYICSDAENHLDVSRRFLRHVLSWNR